MQRRGLLIGVSAVLGLCLLGCVLVFVSVIPSFRDEVRDGVHDAVATEVARQIPATTGGAAQPGAYTLTAADLEARLRETLDDEQDEQDPVVRITDTQIEIGVTSKGQDAIYTGKPVAEDGKLSIQEMSTDNGIVRFVLPPDTIAGAIEDAVNTHLATNNLRLDSVELTDGQLTLVVSQA
ncbi:MAG TPA: hypothetical protein VFV93_12325 [Thermomicrobiales bacterium]|nr:hypothetical protein [Thermomicrobiales bacterium]